MRDLLHDRLALQAQRRPEMTAVVFQGRATSYGELDAWSNRIARILRAGGCVRGDRVALLLPKSAEAVAGMFGALKADCIYVPLDSASPAPRLAKILLSCECRFLLAAQSTRPVVTQLLAQGGWPGAMQICWLDDTPLADGRVPAEFSWGDVRRQTADPLPSETTEMDPAHILFTSGSTGFPKGVVITHASVTRFVDWALRYFKIDSSDRMSCHSPLHFDLSTFDIHGAIAAGAQVHLVPPELSLLPRRLAEFIRTSALTQWFSVPSILNHMAHWDAVRPGDFPALRRVLWCGEKFPTPGLIYWMRRLPNLKFFNLYGPTETTIASSYYHVRRCPKDDAAEVPIGYPCDGEQLLVLDEQLQPAAPTQVGDLYIAGAGLSPGYWRDDARTSQVFVANPYGSGVLARMYRTGDLARVGFDGHIYLVGRSDSQIKLRGHRVELGEIEAAIYTVPGLADAAVVAIDTTDFEGAAICCAYVPSPGTTLSPIVLKSEVARVLPHYMTPAYWITVDQMPRNANGKVDRPKLVELFERQREQFRAVKGTAHVA